MGTPQERERQRDRSRGIRIRQENVQCTERPNSFLLSLPISGFASTLCHQLMRWAMVLFGLGSHIVTRKYRYSTIKLTNHNFWRALAFSGKSVRCEHGIIDTIGKFEIMGHCFHGPRATSLAVFATLPPFHPFSLLSCFASYSSCLYSVFTDKKA